MRTRPFHTRQRDTALSRRSIEMITRVQSFERWRPLCGRSFGRGRCRCGPPKRWPTLPTPPAWHLFGPAVPGNQTNTRSRGGAGREGARQGAEGKQGCTPLFLSAGVSIGMRRGCQQKMDAGPGARSHVEADGGERLPQRRQRGLHPRLDLIVPVEPDLTRDGAQVALARVASSLCCGRLTRAPKRWHAGSSGRVASSLCCGMEERGERREERREEERR